MIKLYLSVNGNYNEKTPIWLIEPVELSIQTKVIIF